MTMLNLEGKTALVTGGSRGIGKEIAKKLAAQGATVIVSGTNEENLKQVAEELGGRYVVANLSDTVALKAMADELAPEVDILVNNAGITKDGLFMRQSDDDWDSVMNVNLDAAVKLTRAITAKMMRKKWGRVINVTSVVAHMGNVGQTNYVASKAAMTGFTKALAVEIARKNVTVNCVAPGFIETAMTKEMSDAASKEFLAKIPANRFGTAEEVANAVAFLASNEASYITGTTLHINGGLYV
jgi:3-oxoacyl-[acyl-carrier protein] reductase